MKKDNCKHCGRRIELLGPDGGRWILIPGWLALGTNCKFIPHGHHEPAGKAVAVYEEELV